MKTSELKKWLDENGWGYIEEEDFINVEDIKIYKKIGMLDIPNSLVFGVGSDTSMMLQKAIEYLETPISKREDDKYIIKTSIPTMGDYVIYLNSEENEFILFPISQKFTQVEIDKFPKEIKGAIECGFLRKVEVND